MIVSLRDADTRSLASGTRFARFAGMEAVVHTIGAIVVGRRSITADTDLRLCRFFGLSDGYWLRAQAAYDTEVAHERLAGELERIRPWVAA